MRIAFTLDYELFLGARSGSVNKCLVEPLKALQNAAPQVHFTIFVDATYLYRVNQLMEADSAMAADFEALVAHITQLRDSGHDIQLHIHPHWVYSTFDNGEWILDHDHYKLSDFSIEEANEIVKQSKDLLDNILGYKTSIFRAGGFSAQPTEMLTTIFKNNGIIVDSTVCPGNVYDSPQQQYDYRTAPDVDYYHFSNDICEIDTNGEFIEVPITMHRVSPIFHWKLAFNRLFFSNSQKYGDGVSVKTTNESIIQRLTKFYDCQATIDGYKVNLLEKAYNSAQKRGHQLFTVLGHPKLATPYSVERFGVFVRKIEASEDNLVTLSELYNE